MKLIKMMIDKSNEMENDKEEKKRRHVSIQTYFCIGVCDVWKRKNAIHLTLKKLRKKYNLK